jgi:hypothetical protein
VCMCWEYLKIQFVSFGLLHRYYMWLKPMNYLVNNVGFTSYCNDNMCSWLSYGCVS